MTTVTVSSKGQLVLPAATRRRLGLSAGAKLQLAEEPDGLRLTVVRAAHAVPVAQLAGLVTAPSKGKPRRLSEFDAAQAVRHPKGRV